ncbi:MAG: hypothetical protein ACK4NP_06970 [Parvularculaceae bacterium]
MPIDLFLLLVGAGALMLGAASFRAPAGVYRKAGLGLVLGIGGPIALACALSPFLGDGAGLGIALILYVWSALVLAAAFSAALGASFRHLWNFLGR